MYPLIYLNQGGKLNNVYKFQFVYDSGKCEDVPKGYWQHILKR